HPDPGCVGLGRRAAAAFPRGPELHQTRAGWRPMKRRSTMRRRLAIALMANVLMLSPAALAQQPGGTAAEAKAMLERAVAAVKTDKPKALTMFTKGEGGFKDRDLYPFCFDAKEGTVLAGPPFVVGKDIRTFKDSTGKEFGKENFKAAIEGKFT